MIKQIDDNHWIIQVQRVNLVHEFIPLVTHDHLILEAAYLAGKRISSYRLTTEPDYYHFQRNNKRLVFAKDLNDLGPKIPEIIYSDPNIRLVQFDEDYLLVLRK